MTREEAIHELNEWLEQMIQHGVPSHSAKRKALATAIQALEQEPRSVSRWIDADLDPNFAKCKNCSEHEVDIAYSKDFIKQERWN